MNVCRNIEVCFLILGMKWNGIRWKLTRRKISSSQPMYLYSQIKALFRERCDIFKIYFVLPQPAILPKPRTMALNGVVLIILFECRNVSRISSQNPLRSPSNPTQCRFPEDLNTISQTQSFSCVSFTSSLLQPPSVDFVSLQPDSTKMLPFKPHVFSSISYWLRKLQASQTHSQLLQEWLLFQVLIL